MTDAGGEGEVRSREAAGRRRISLQADEVRWDRVRDRAQAGFDGL
jgi:hypothetical protein